MDSEFRGLPSVDRLISETRISELRDDYPHDLLVDLIREHLKHQRLSIAHGNPCPTADEIADDVCAHVESLVSPGLRHVINATDEDLSVGRRP